MKLTLVKVFVVAVMISVGIFFLISCSQSEGGNWKEFFKDKHTIWQYDKSSIHYPQQKKILGFTVRNKEIVNVWMRYNKDSAELSNAILTRIYCVERAYKGASLIHFSGDDWYPLVWPDLPNSVSNDRVKPDPIEPGSPYESLLKKVCP
jgi:hypothetical protein